MLEGRGGGEIIKISRSERTRGFKKKEVEGEGSGFEERKKGEVTKERGYIERK